MPNKGEKLSKKQRKNLSEFKYYWHQHTTSEDYQKIRAFNFARLSPIYSDKQLKKRVRIISLAIGRRLTESEMQAVKEGRAHLVKYLGLIIDDVKR